MKETYIRIAHLQLLSTTISWEIGKGELNAVIGANRSGKSLLAKIICGKVFDYKGQVSKTIKDTDIVFADYTADSLRFHYSDFYYQQRYNAFDVADLETIQELLAYNAGDVYQNSIFNKILPSSVLSKKIIELSSGESRKVVILKSILKPAKVYVLDNPFTGLDNNSIVLLIDVFKMMTQQYGKTVVLLLNKAPEDIVFDTVIHLNNPHEVIVNSSSFINDSTYKTPETSFNIVFKIKNQHLKVGNKTLIHDVSWTIGKGEKWVLKGANGSGKSTLMSLINADNGIAYSLDIILFDKLRGTGESIWDIKSKIGFVSPEIQLFWNRAMSVKDTIRSGFSNTKVLNRKITEQEQQRYERLIGIFQLQSMEEVLFASLSVGDKRIVMVARALVNNPPLLILDEPFQGLDEARFKFLYERLSAFADEERTVVQITHHENELLPCINRTAHIKNNDFIIE
jgi:molybdate transport system ATP-binding protein